MTTLTSQNYFKKVSLQGFTFYLGYNIIEFGGIKTADQKDFKIF